MTTVEEHLEDLRLHRGSVFTIVVRLRAMALASGPAITEEVKYGGILFASYAAFCGVFAYQNHVTLEFSEGNTLADPFGVLAGKGKFRRHIRLDDERDIEANHLEAYIRAARAQIDGTSRQSQ
jgi:hypothetical protein